MRRLSRVRSCAAVALVSLCVPALLPALTSAAAPSYTKESKQAFEKQLDKHEVATAAINHTVGTVRLTLEDGRNFKFHYAAGAQKATEAKLRAHGVSVTEIKSKKKKKSHTLGAHPRRTIAIIVVVLVVIAAAAFLLIRRRRFSRD